MTKTYWLYMMCNWTNDVLYIGVTNDLERRVAEHKAKVQSGFTADYNADKLVIRKVTTISAGDRPGEATKTVAA